MPCQKGHSGSICSTVKLPRWAGTHQTPRLSRAASSETSAFAFPLAQIASIHPPPGQPGSGLGAMHKGPPWAGVLLQLPRASPAHECPSREPRAALCCSGWQRRARGDGICHGHASSPRPPGAAPLMQPTIAGCSCGSDMHPEHSDCNEPAGAQPQPGPEFRRRRPSGGGRGAPDHAATHGSAPALPTGTRSSAPHRRRLLAAKSLSTGILWVTPRSPAEGHCKNPLGAAAFTSESSRGPQGRAALVALSQSHAPAPITC